MTDKERLEEIKNVRWENLKTSQILHVKWLIGRAQELENLNDAFDDLDSDYVDLQEENKRYRDALEFYGNKENYLHELSRLKATNYSKVMDDYGEIARKALESDWK